MTDVNKVLEDRGRTHGDFNEQARLSQDIKDLFKSSKLWWTLEPFHREALEMIAHKISRALMGNATFLDHYSDIIGYTKLISDELKKRDGTTDVEQKRFIIKDGIRVDLD